MKSDSGFASITVIVILFAVSLFAASLGTELTLTMAYVKKSEQQKKTEALLHREVEHILTLLNTDPTPKSDSLFDSVWSYINKKSYLYKTFILRDISSRININSVRPGFLQKTKLRSSLKKGISFDMFTDYRNRIGWALNTGPVYREIMQQEALEKYFTSYNFANVNTAYEYTLQDMFLNLTGNLGAAEVFHTFIADALRRRHILSEEELSGTFGNMYQSVYPIISTLPEMNIHFIPEFLLEQVLSYPYGGKKLPGSSTILKELLDLRAAGEITTEELQRTIPAQGLQKRIFQYLGTKTSFWKITVATEMLSARGIIISYPLTSAISFNREVQPAYTCQLYSYSVDRNSVPFFSELTTGQH